MERIIRVPGKPFANALAALRVELQRIIQRQDEEFPIERLFDFIRLTEANSAFQKKLLARGSFAQVDDRFTNKARRSFSERLVDLGPNIDALRVYMPRNIVMDTSVNSENILTFELTEMRRNVIIEFDDEPAPGFGTSFVLDKVTGGDEGWRYFCYQEFEPDKKVTIFVDTELEAALVAGSRSNFRLLTRPALLHRDNGESAGSVHALGGFLEICRCKCCEVPDNPKPCPPPGAQLDLKIRGILVSDDSANFPAMESNYLRWLAETQTLYSSRADLQITSAGHQMIIDPLSVDIDAAPCNIGQPSSDTEMLWDKHYGAAQDGVVVAFVLHSLLGATVGCAAHPPGRPGFTLERFSSDWVFAHELGHVLDLRHIENSDNLMNPSSPFTNPPPDLTAAQISTMRCSNVI